jgi:hypothetical protein
MADPSQFDRFRVFLHAHYNNRCFWICHAKARNGWEYLSIAPLTYDAASFRRDEIETVTKVMQIGFPGIEIIPVPCNADQLTTQQRELLRWNS